MRTSNSSAFASCLIMVLGLVSTGALTNHDLLSDHAKVVDTNLKGHEFQPHKHTASVPLRETIREASARSGKNHIKALMTDNMKLLDQLVEEAGRTAANSKLEKSFKNDKSKDRWDEDCESNKGKHHSHSSKSKQFMDKRQAWKNEVSSLRRKNRFQEHEIKKLTKSANDRNSELRIVQKRLEDAHLEIENLKTQLHQQQHKHKAEICSLEDELAHCKKQCSKEPMSSPHLHDKLLNLEIDIKLCRERVSKLESDCSASPPIFHPHGHFNKHHSAPIVDDHTKTKPRVKIMMGSSIDSDLY